ncbi:hypothetical protein RJ639_007746 [Escallonia herrerae]|uniref:Uncharacterized protein n=1 Tax=Escallonia herrerae TaxID=1293975 RepID=A0AA88VX27_9ASTE|nr:hypothetical protein RJ639_007746 [Escallonia herrerae]
MDHSQMSSTMSNHEEQGHLKDGTWGMAMVKKLAAVEYVKSGMVLGLGTRSIAAFVVAKLGALLKSNEQTNIVGVPTSK